MLTVGQLVFIPDSGYFRITGVSQTEPGTWTYSMVAATTAQMTDEERISEAMAEAIDNPGRIVTR